MRAVGPVISIKSTAKCPTDRKTALLDVDFIFCDIECLSHSDVVSSVVLGPILDGDHIAFQASSNVMVRLNQTFPAIDKITHTSAQAGCPTRRRLFQPEA